MLGSFGGGEQMQETERPEPSLRFLQTGAHVGQANEKADQLIRAVLDQLHEIGVEDRHVLSRQRLHLAFAHRRESEN